MNYRYAYGFQALASLLFIVVIWALVGNRAEVKNTDEQYPLYNKHDVVVQLPIMFTLNHDLVSDKTDMVGFCLSVKNRDVECYTMKGRFLGVGTVSSFYDGKETSVYVMDAAPEQYRRIMTNAFQRVWAE